MCNDADKSEKVDHKIILVKPVFSDLNCQTIKVDASLNEMRDNYYQMRSNLVAICIAGRTKKPLRDLNNG